MAPNPFAGRLQSVELPPALDSFSAYSWRSDTPRLQGVALRLLGIIQEQPGLHFRGLGRAAGLTSAGQLRHHVDRLLRCGAIAEVKDGRFSRYFAAGEHDARSRDGLARLARPLPLQIATHLLQRPMTRTELRRRLGCADSTLGYHLNRMVRMGDLDRRPARGPYALADPNAARELVAYLQRSHGPSERERSAQDRAPHERPSPFDRPGALERQMPSWLRASTAPTPLTAAPPTPATPSATTPDATTGNLPFPLSAPGALPSDAPRNGRVSVPYSAST